MPLRSRFDSTDRPRASVRRANPLPSSPYSISTPLTDSDRNVHASNASRVSNSRYHNSSHNPTSSVLFPRSRYSQEESNSHVASAAAASAASAANGSNTTLGNGSTPSRGDAAVMTPRQQQHQQQQQQPPASVVESAILHADSELVTTAECAVLEADRCQRELQNWRTIAQQERVALEEAERRKVRMEKEIQELEQKAARLDQDAMSVVVPPTQASGNLNGQKSLHDAPRFNGAALTRQTAADSVLPGTFNAYDGNESNVNEVMELRYLSSKVISIIEDVEDEVSRQRRKYDDVALQRRLLVDELDRIRAAVNEKKKRRDELTHLKLFVAASLANPVQRQVLESAHRVEELRREVMAKQRAMCVQRTERASMTKHLLIGAHEKAKEVERATQTLLQSSSSSDNQNNNNNSNSASVGAKDMYHHPLSQTVQELMREHKIFIQTVEMHEGEHCALEEYVTVLADRFMNETALNPERAS